MLLVMLGPNNRPITIPINLPQGAGMLHGREWAKAGVKNGYPSPAHYLQGPPLNYQPPRLPKQERVNRNALSRSLSDSSEEKKKSSNSRYKTELCRPYQESGTCKYAEKCQFAHGENELRNVPRHPKYKTEKCKTFHTTGFCPYGPRCHFIHNTAEEANLPPPPRMPRPAMRPQQLVPSQDLLLNLAHQRQRQLSIQALPCGLGSVGDSPVPSSAGSSSPSSFCSSDEGEAGMFPWRMPVTPPPMSVDSLASGLESLFSQPGTPKRLPVFSRLSSAAA